MEGGNAMAHSLNLSLTDELRAFVDRNSGDGTLYATPSEFVRDMIRRYKLQQDAAEVRAAIIDGYQDAIAGRTVAFEGDLRSLVDRAKK
jgi:antitoxin ParD1/3/4